MEPAKSTPRDPYARTRVLYILEAAFEYFISLMVTSAYLAKLTDAIGMSDSLTGILSAFVSLGLGFQLLALLRRPDKPVRRWVTLIHILNQLCFTLLYAVPLFPATQGVKVGVFIALLLLGHIGNNLINSPKINWYMSLVPDDRRGRFTATKEIVSLLGGMVFSFVMGQISDHFYAIGRDDLAFVCGALTLLFLTVAHTLTLLFSREAPPRAAETKGAGRTTLALLRDRRFLAVTGLSVLWSITNYATTPFYGTWQIKELGFSLTFVAVLAALYSISRALVSHPLGRLADRTSFSHMLIICFALEAVGYLFGLCTTPENGHILFPLYYICHALGMGGINSGEINLIYDFVPADQRTGALAIKNTLTGLLGFLTTLLVSPLVSYIQSCGNQFLGLSVYAQQVLSAIGLVLCLLILLYLYTVIGRIPRGPRGDTATALSQSGAETDA